MIKSKNLAGIGFQEESQRVYPEGSLASQTLGFVNGEGKGQYGIEEALNERRKAWKAPEPKIKKGYLSRYERMVSSASEGAVVK